MLGEGGASNCKFQLLKLLKQTVEMLEMADQEKSDFDVIFTLSPCLFKLYKL